jgi:predicted O-methyltransferase YrrM
MKFSQSWFMDSEINKKLSGYLNETDFRNILEIGCFEGMSSVFFAENFLSHSNSTLTCVDPFLSIDNNDHNIYLQNNEELHFYHNILNCKNSHKIKIYKMTSDLFFENNKVTFDFIYIDGCHEPEFVERDLTNSFKFLNINGIIWMDDYLGGEKFKIKNAIDKTLEQFKSHFEIIHEGYQLAIKKLI